LIRERFNAGAVYKDRILKWDTVIEQKTRELGGFLAAKRVVLDFADPAPKPARQDNNELRARILALTASDAKELGIGKSTLHYLRKKAEGADCFDVRRHTLAKINQIQQIMNSIPRKQL
jgi:hypothetical protein